MNYLNEWSAYHAQWCRNLADAGEIPACVVDETDIRQVTGDRLNEYQQCHFFAGIAGWPLALKLAGVPDDFPVWTGSCHCQPFSRMGKRKGKSDERHLWPEFRRLFRQCRPRFMFGEQVAGADGIGWINAVHADLEEDGYAVVSAELCSPLVSADHGRPRIYWGAWDISDFRPVRFASDCDDDGNCPDCGIDYAECECPGPTEDGVVYAEVDGELFGCRVADSVESRQSIPGRAKASERGWSDCLLERKHSLSKLTDGVRLVYPEREGPQGFGQHGNDWRKSGRDIEGPPGSTAETVGDLCFVECENGNWRRFQSGSFPMAHGIPRRLGRGKSELDRMARDARANRVGRIHGYGNAIVPELAAMFVRVFFESVFTGVDGGWPGV